jgi:hypothetical protein
VEPCTDCGKSNTSAALAIEVSYFTLLHDEVVATPDSAVPSLTESSPASIDTDDVTRVLFDIDTEQKSSTVRRVRWQIRMVQTEILSTLLMSPLDRLRCL